MSDDLRSTLAQTDDSRALETRRRLVEAWTRAAQDGVADIGVAAVARAAGVGRSTFYTHFATIEDLAVTAASELFTQGSAEDVERRTAHRLGRREITRLGLEQLVADLWEGRALLVSAVSLPTGAVVRQRIAADVARSLVPTILAERPGLSEDELRLTASYIAGGVANLVLAWIDEPTVDRDDLVEYLLSLLPGWMTG